MTVTTILAAVQRHVFDAARTWRPWRRAAWCREQRDILSTSGGSVVWVRGDTASWATWGARHGYFELQFMDALPYLRAAARTT